MDESWVVVKTETKLTTVVSQETGAQWKSVSCPPIIHPSIHPFIHPSYSAGRCWFICALLNSLLTHSCLNSIPCPPQWVLLQLHHSSFKPVLGLPEARTMWWHSQDELSKHFITISRREALWKKIRHIHCSNAYVNTMNLH